MVYSMRSKHTSTMQFILLKALVFMCFIAPFTENASFAVESDYRFDVRQNVLFMSWPSGMPETIVPNRSFGISETRARGRITVYAGDFVLGGELESGAGFSSKGAGTLREGGLFNIGEPLERWDWTQTHIDDGSANLDTRIERLDVVWYHGTLTIDIGRQPVSLGTSHFVGVLDVLAPFSPGDLDATYKPGIDAVRIRRGIGMAGEAELIAAGAKDWNGGALLGRFRTMYHGVDFEFVGGRFRRRGFGGLGWEGEIREQSIWGELALFGRRDDVEKIRAGWSWAAFSGVAGIEFDLPDDYLLGVAGLYQDFGARDPEDLQDVYTDAPFREGWAFLGSAAYSVLTLNKELHPLVQGNLAGIVNLVDSSMLFQPRITVNTGDNSDLAFYAWVGTGKKSRMDGISVDIRSEFGQMPDGGGFYARWFF